MHFDITKYWSGNDRSAVARKNIILSIFLKGISICISLLLVPITINYLSPSQYGIWITLSAIISWISFFDMGFTHGFRNKFAEAKAKGNILDARMFVSTTYFTLFLLFGVILTLCLVATKFINWAEVLGVSSSMKKELEEVISILTIFFCIQMILQVVTTMIIADQKNAIASAINLLGSIISLVVIYILTKTTGDGSLISLAYTISFIPSAVLLLVTIICFKYTRYRLYKPTVSMINLKAAKYIFSLGGGFFIIQISSIFVFQSTNLIISHTVGPESVTQYNIAYRYFNSFNMLMGLFIAPYWSAFTDAFAKEDFGWMINIYRKLNILWLWMALVIGLFYIISPIIIKIWIHDAIAIPTSLLFVNALYILIVTRASISVNLINGIGKIKIQMLVHLFFSIITIPILYLIVEHFGVALGILFLCLNPLVHMIFSRKQLNLILTQKATGIWLK